MSDSLPSLIAQLEAADLKGHGGASFSTATKLRAVATERGRPAVVVNATEGEPLSFKDRHLLSTVPAVVIDGALLAADALGADRVVVAVEANRVRSIAAIQQTLASLPPTATRRRTITVAEVPAGYVSGQETALISFLNGGAAKPTVTPPFPFQQGLRGQPTLVSNAETFAQIARIVRGTHDETRLITVSGAVPRPAVVRATPEINLAELLNTAGGVTERVSGLLLGGYGGTWARVPDAFALPVRESVLRDHGLTLGAGIVLALGESVCPVAEVAQVTRWMAAQGAGQCGPCAFGLPAIAGLIGQLCDYGEPGAVVQLTRWCAMVERRGACAHPDGVARYVRTALNVFSTVFEDHARHGCCDRCATTLREHRHAEAVTA